METEQFEYKEESYDYYKYIEKLNEEGKNGWECIHLKYIEKESCDYYKCIFKRKINKKFKYIEESYGKQEYMKKLNESILKDLKILSISDTSFGKTVIYKEFEK